MAATFIQAKANVDTVSCVATMAGAITNGSLLVAFCTVNTVNNITANTGWTLEISGAATGGYCRPHVLSKVAGGAESTTQTPILDANGAGTCVIFELGTPPGTYASMFETQLGQEHGSTASSAPPGDEDSYNDQPHTITAAGNTIVLLGGGVRRNSGSTPIPTISVLTNITGDNDPALNRAAFGGYKIVTDTTVVTPEMTWDASHNFNGIILLGLNTDGGGGTVTETVVSPVTRVGALSSQFRYTILN